MDRRIGIQEASFIESAFEALKEKYIAEKSQLNKPTDTWVNHAETMRQRWQDIREEMEDVWELPEYDDKDIYVHIPIEIKVESNQVEQS